MEIAKLLFELVQDTHPDKLRTSTSVPSLCAAACGRHLELVKWLLKSGMDTNAHNRSTHSAPLIIAASRGSTRIAQRLVTASADPSQCDDTNDNVRTASARSGQLTVLRLRT